MSYLSPSFLLIQENLQNCKPMRESKKSFNLQASKLRNSGLKDPETKKFTLPDLQGHEKRNIAHRRSGSKLRLLPNLKPNASEVKPKVSNPVMCTGKNLSINILNKKNSLLKERLQFLIRPEIPSETIKIEITTCENINQVPCVLNTLSQKILNPPSISPEANSINSSQNRSVASNVIRRSYSQSDADDLNDDAFYYSNILKHINFTSFQSILDGKVDAHCNSFPYCTRIIKNFLKIKPCFRKVPQKAPKCRYECKCLKEKFLQVPKSAFKPHKTKLLSFNNSGTVIPNLQCVFRGSHDHVYKENLIILNLEGVVGSLDIETRGRSGIFKVLRELSEYMRFVLVVSLPNEKCMKILELLQKMQINISAAYQRGQVSNKEVNKLQDYSLVYQDFQVKKPGKHVLVITSHKIADPIDDETLVASKTGVSLKLNIERAPLASVEYKDPPYTMLVPSVLLGENLQMLHKTVKSLQRYTKTEKKINFPRFFRETQFTVMPSCAVHATFLESLQFEKKKFLKTMDPIKIISKKIGYCSLHNKYIYQQVYTLSQNFFVIN